MATVTIRSDFGAQENKVLLFPLFPLLFCQEVMGLDAMILVFGMLSLSQPSHSPLSPLSRGSLVPLHFLPLGWYHLHI